MLLYFVQDGEELKCRWNLSLESVTVGDICCCSGLGRCEPLEHVWGSSQSTAITMLTVYCHVKARTIPPLCLLTYFTTCSGSCSKVCIVSACSSCSKVCIASACSSCSKVCRASACSSCSKALQLLCTALHRAD